MLAMDATKCPGCGSIFENLDEEEEEKKYVCPECGTLNPTDTTECSICNQSFSEQEKPEPDEDLSGLEELESMAKDMEMDSEPEEPKPKLKKKIKR